MNIEVVKVKRRRIRIPHWINPYYWAIPFSLGCVLEEDGLYFVIRCLCFTVKKSVDYED